jgi:hypothetical protein
VHALARRVLVSLIVGAGMLVVTPAALGALAPTMTLDQSAGTQAGATLPLGMDMKFAPTGSDSPKDLTISLPDGLLASASIDGGACLHTTTATPKCQVGSGTANANLLSLLAQSVPLKFYLVAPPKAGDLAGLITMATLPLVGTSQLGSAADIVIRSASDPRGVGVNISLKNLPNTFNGLPLALNELKSSFAGLRMPTSCPATPATVQATVDSYSDPTVRTMTAPLHVTGCAKVPFTAAFHATATKDAHGQGVKIVTDLSQPASPPQLVAKTVKLSLPVHTLLPSPAALPFLCANVASGTCHSVGSAVATSPLYPTPLTGKVYLTGTVATLGIAIVFPPPFALTIRGTVAAATNTTTFQNIPDLPQSDLKVTLFGGQTAAFATNCIPPSGTASAVLTSQDGNRTAKVSSHLTVAGCPVHHKHHKHKHHKAGARITGVSMSGLAAGKPGLAVGVVSAKGGAKIRGMVLSPPPGMSFLAGKVIKAVGGQLKSALIANGRLIIALRSGVPALVLRVPGGGLSETAAVRNKARHHRLGVFRLGVTVVDSHGKRTNLAHTIKVRS